MKSEKFRMTINIPIKLNEKLLAEAEKEKRSRQAQIVYMLEKSFENGNGKKEKTK